MLDSDINTIKPLLFELNRILDDIEEPIKNSSHAEELKELYIELGAKLNEKKCP